MPTPNTVDLIIIIALLYGAWKGYCSGLIHNLINLLSLVAVYVCGVLYGNRVAEFLEQQFRIHSRLSAYAGSSIAKMISVPAAAPEGAASDLMQQLRQLRLPVAAIEFIEEQLLNLTRTTLGSVVDDTATLLGMMLSNLLVNALIFIVILGAVNIVAGFVYWLLRDVLHLAKSGLDSLAGMCLGLLQTVLIVALILALLTPIMAWQEEAQFAMMIEQSFLADFILSFFYSLVGSGIIWQV